MQKYLIQNSEKQSKKETVYKTAKSECYIINNWLENTDANEIYKKAMLLPLIKHPKCIIYGKECTMRRSIGFFSNLSAGYKYSGQMAEARPIPDWLQEITDKVNSFLQTKFNGILVNHYENGGETIGAHSDDESALFDGKVACISLGTARTFRIRNKTTFDVKETTTLHGQLLVMQGDFQKECTHEIPTEKKITDDRISLTFRYHLS